MPDPPTVDISPIVVLEQANASKIASGLQPRTPGWIFEEEQGLSTEGIYPGLAISRSCIHPTGSHRFYRFLYLVRRYHNETGIVPSLFMFISEPPDIVVKLQAPRGVHAA